MKYLLLTLITATCLSLQSAELAQQTQLTDLPDDCIKHVASFAYTPRQQVEKSLELFVSKKSTNEEYLESVRKNGLEILEQLYYTQLSSPELLCTNKRIYSVLNNDFLLKDVYENIWNIVSQLPACMCESFVDVFDPYRTVMEGRNPYRTLDALTSHKIIESNCASDAWWLTSNGSFDFNGTFLQQGFIFGADPKERNKLGLTFYQMCERIEELYGAGNNIMELHKKLINVYDFVHLTDMSAAVPHLIEGRRWPTLLCMIRNGHVTLSGFPRILYRHKKNVNSVDKFGRSFLSYALNFPFKDINTKKYILELLIEIGADIDLLSKGEQQRIETEFAYIFEEYRLEKELHAHITKKVAQTAVQHGVHVELSLVEDLLRRGANPNTVIHGKSAIRMAIDSKGRDYTKANIVALLLNYGAQWLPEYQSPTPSSEWMFSKESIIDPTSFTNFAQQPTHSGVRLSYDPKLSVMKLLGIFKQPFKNN